MSFYKKLDLVTTHINFLNACVCLKKNAMLLRQEPLQEDQSLSEIACYASESSLVEMLYRAGSFIR